MMMIPKTVSLREVVWTVAMVLVTAQFIYIFTCLMKKNTILKRAGQNGAIAFMYMKDLVIAGFVIGVGVTGTLLGVLGMSLPEPARQENATAGEIIAYIFIVGAVLLAVFGVFTIWINDRIEEEANKEQQKGHESDG